MTPHEPTALVSGLRRADSPERTERVQSLPPLNRDLSFWGMTVTQFLGAFNDNLFKQLILLLAVPIGAASVSEEDQQGLATVVFSLPFVLFSGLAGFLSDRYSKRRIIVLSKVAEIVAMLLGMLAFMLFGLVGYPGLLVVLFVMGAQSAFFGPGKYGILPEMLREEDLSRANGIIVMTTFLAIIFGTASAGGLGDQLIDPDQPLGASASRLWMGSAVCVLIAVAGTLTSLLVRRVPASAPGLRFESSSLAVPPDTRRMLRVDRPLVMALLASCMFWLVSGAAMQAVNSLGLVQLGLNKFWTSVLVAIIGVGIALGAAIAGRLSRGRVDFRFVSIGSWGIVMLMVLVSLSRPGGVHLLGFWGSIPALILLGMSAGFFAIPVQVFMQARPPEGQKGRMIAVMNQANFFAIVLSGVVYHLFDRIVVAFEWPRSVIFAMMSGLMLPVALWYRPQMDGT
jgi:acyl-[acyl-carrier-protein]-phospholipid O-acyltransferase/long-chain-fatty-acid--[acyl-carrier-protein] ligase